METVEARYGLAQRIWVRDRGMTSEDNLAWLRETGRRGTPESELRRWARPIADGQDWEAIRDGIEAKRCVGPEGAETFVLIRSIERREQEQAIHARFARRIDEGLARPACRIAHARRPRDRGRLERQLGRLLARNSRAAGRYVIEVLPDPTVPAGLRLSWSARPEWDDWARWSEGCYVLRSDIPAWSPEALWRTSLQLIEAEAAFRIQTSDLSLRPIWHQRADRVQAHILVCFWPTGSGGRWSNGSGGPGSGKARGPSSRNSAASKAPTWSCRPWMVAPCASDAWCARIALKLPCWLASASTSPSGSASRHPSRGPLRCSADFSRKYLKWLTATLRTAEVGLARAPPGAGDGAAPVATRRALATGAPGGGRGGPGPLA